MSTNLRQVIDNIPYNQNIIVYANYRTGSTALVEHISAVRKIRSYSELFHPVGVNDAKLADIIGPCVFKIMPAHDTPVEFSTFVTKAYTIGLSRRSLVHQIASMYISVTIGDWHYTTVGNKSYDIVIDTNKLGKEMDFIIAACNKYAERNIQKDIELYYEDIEDQITNAGLVVGRKPNNYQELLDTIRYLLKEKKIEYAEN